jgi:hypothetical protein
MTDAGASPDPPAPAGLRALLPAVEPDRTLDDWGRSERVEALFDRTVADFLYHLWFRSAPASPPAWRSASGSACRPTSCA